MKYSGKHADRLGAPCDKAGAPFCIFEHEEDNHEYP